MTLTSLTLKKNTAKLCFYFLLSIIYGTFVVASLQRLYFLQSGDINALVNFFDDIDIYTTFNAYSLRGDGLFRIIVEFVGNLFNIEPLTVLSSIAFTTSTIFFYMYAASVRSSTYLVYILPLFLMVFLTPLVTNLFASGIRSSIAFTLLFVGFIHSREITRYVLFGLSGLLHLSMVPIISLYILFHLLRILRIPSAFLIPIMILTLYSLFISIAAFIFKFNITVVGQSFYYNSLIFFIAFMIIFSNKKAIQNVYGFISIGLILIYLFGLILDISFIRYVGNSILLYLFFLVTRGEAGTIQVFTISYVPFFAIGVFFGLANFT